jgi:SSS family solute:Na+ symporter/sodium/proline symporter
LNVYLIVVLAYLGVLVAVAIVKSRKVKTKADFMVAGRSVPTFFLIATLVCTWVGSGSLFGGAGLAFRMGIGDLWMSAGAWLGIIIVMFIAARVRRIADYSVPELLERRYNSTARLLGTLVIMIAYLSIAAYQFKGAGRLLNLVTPINADLTALTGWDLPWGTMIAALVIMVFTALAGMVSVVSIDVFNGTLMIVGVFVAFFVLLGKAGGWSEVVHSLPPERFEAFAGRGPIWALGVFFPTFFLLLGESSMYQKFLSAKSAISARRAALGMVIGVVAIETALAFVAIVGSSIYRGKAPFYEAASDGSAPVVVEAQTENIILHLARFDLPLVAGCLLLCAGLAVIFSTGNTFLMVPSLNAGHDVYKRFLRKNASDAEVVRVQRIMIFVFGALAFILLQFFSTILAMAFMAYNMVGAGLTPALLATFLWKRVTPQGAVASIVTGMATILVCNFAPWLKDHFDSEYHIYPAILLSLTALVSVSLMTPASPREKWEPFMAKVDAAKKATA